MISTHARRPARLATGLALAVVVGGAAAGSAAAATPSDIRLDSVVSRSQSVTTVTTINGRTITQGLGMFIGAQIIGKLVKMNTTGEGDLAVIDWKQVWMVPCIFAGVIMVIFFLFFRDPGRKSKAGVPAVDEMDERTTM